ncbi:hypothetical protein ACFQ6H_21170 [Rhodococcus sp. NPDC056506]|uniref:hypothetical protein n=1 Tax=Rhodococcus sp. NPDC056506 TaxID=3345844 RepID=UPI0036722523
MANTTAEDPEFEGPIFGKHIGDLTPHISGIIGPQSSPEFQAAMRGLMPAIDTGVFDRLRETLLPKLSPMFADIAFGDTELKNRILGLDAVMQISPPMTFPNIVDPDRIFGSAISTAQTQLIESIKIAPELTTNISSIFRTALADLVLPTDDRFLSILDHLKDVELDEDDLDEFEAQFEGTAFAKAVDDAIPELAKHRMIPRKAVRQAACVFAMVVVTCALASVSKHVDNEVVGQWLQAFEEVNSKLGFGGIVAYPLGGKIYDKFSPPDKEPGSV